MKTQDEMVLRGHMLCPTCGRLMTGSCSRGRGGKYYYYHCVAPCRVRFRADTVNQLFEKQLMEYTAKPGMLDVYFKVVNNVYKTRSGQHGQEIIQINEKIASLQENIQKARNKFMTDQIERVEYNDFRKQCEMEIEKAEARLFTVSTQTSNIDQILGNAVRNLSNLGAIWASADNKGKRTVISSIFPEKIDFDGERFRTQRLNEVVRLIFNIGAGSSENKNGQIEEKIDLSTSVARPGFEPRHTEPKSVVLPLYYQAFHSHSHRMGCKNRVAPQLFQIF